MRVNTKRQNDILVLNDPGIVNTCQSYTFSWSTTVRDAALELILYYVPDVQVTPSPSASSPLPTFTNTGTAPIRKRAPPNVPENSIAVYSWSLSTQASSFDWGKVDAPQGVYFLYGSIDAPPLADISELFSIYNGTDVSCLTTTLPSASVSISDSLPSATSADPAPTSITSPSTTPSSTPITPVPVGGSSSSVNIGAIVGGVVGGVGVVVAAVLAYFFFIVRRRRRQLNDNKRSPPSIKSDKRGTGKGGAGIGRWKGLGSVDMHDTEGNTGGFITGRSYSTESTNKEVADVSEESAATSMGYSSPVPPGIQVRRASLSGPKKTARKPVPSYLDSTAPSPPPISGTPSPTFDGAAYPSAITERKYSASSSTSIGHKRELKHTYADSPKDPDEEVAEAMVRGLKHKASYGDMMQMKPVHYLMPDKPLEEQR